MIKLAPSILAANFAYLADDVLTVERAGAHYVHMDVMDGVFVPNLSLGAPVIKSLRNVTDMTFDVHLMIAEPMKYLDLFVDAGADIINFHMEAVADPVGMAREVRMRGKQVAVTIKPQTPVESVFGLLGEVDMVLVMSVEPGFGGQTLIPDALKKAERIAERIAKENVVVDIEMDGGIDIGNVRDVLQAGVTVVVAGSSVFGTEDIGKSVHEFYTVFKEFGARR